MRERPLDLGIETANALHALGVDVRRPPADVHHLKTHPAPFQAAWEGRKGYELRKADRDFKIGDGLVLEEFDPDRGYLGRRVNGIITYITKGGEWGLPEGLCVLSFRMFSREVRHAV